MRAGQVRTHEGGVAFAVDQWTHLRRFLILGSVGGTWYGATSLDDLAYRALKYLPRDGWTHADLPRLAHPRAMDAGRNALYRWIVDDDLLPELAEAAATAHAQRAAFAALAILPEATATADTSSISKLGARSTSVGQIGNPAPSPNAASHNRSSYCRPASGGASLPRRLLEVLAVEMLRQTIVSAEMLAPVSSLPGSIVLAC